MAGPRCWKLPATNVMMMVVDVLLCGRGARMLVCPVGAQDSFLTELAGSIPGIDEAMSFAEVMKQVGQAGRGQGARGGGGGGERGVVCSGVVAQPAGPIGLAGHPSVRACGRTAGGVPPPRGNQPAVGGEAEGGAARLRYGPA